MRAAAEASFKLVLAKYPEQVQGTVWDWGWWRYSIMMARAAKHVFGRLTTGDHAATKIRWCCRGRMFTWDVCWKMKEIGSCEKRNIQAALGMSKGPRCRPNGCEEGSK